MTQVYEGEKFFALTTRLQAQYRNSIEAIREIPVQSPDGNYHPPRPAGVDHREGRRARSTIFREDGSASRR